MLAARIWGRGDLRLEDIPDPGAPPPGWVRLKVDACGICGTDVEELTLGPNIVPTEPHPLSGRSIPLTLGHEAVGTVDVAGEGVRLAPGTRTAVEANLFCGECWWCRRHSYHLCDKMCSLGLMTDGGLAEYLLAPEYMCLPVSDVVPVEHAAVAETLAVAVRAVRRAGIGLGTSVGVVGAGPVGLLTVQAARIAGARTIVVVDKLEERRRLALQLGADAAPAPEDAEPAALDLTNGVGLDTTIEAAGNPAAATAAVRLARKGGRAVLLGVFNAPLAIDMMDFLLGEKEVVGSLSHIYDEDFATAVRLINAGDVKIDPIVTDRIALTDVVDRGFKALIEEPSSHLKIVVLPNG